MAAQDRELVILIHGTGSALPDAEKPRWWQTQGAVAQDLRQRLGPGFDVGETPESAPFHWSGMNSERDRRSAGNALLKRVLQLEAKGVPYHLVGHSHGGSVIWHMLTTATRRGVNLKGLKSWTTVGTPFLEFAPLWHGLLAIAALLIFLLVVVHYLSETGDWFGKLFWTVAQSLQTLTWPAGKMGETLAYVEIVLFVLLAAYLALRPVRWLWRIISHAWRRMLEPVAARRYRDRWLGLWHPYDEPIHGLSATLVTPIWFAPRWTRPTPKWYWRPLSWLYNGLVARPYDRLVAPTVDQFVWTLSMGRLQGSDIYGLTMVDAATAPRALSPGWPHLLAPIADEMSESAGKRAAATANEMRHTLTKLRAKGEGSEAVKEIASAISWSEVLHTAYFEHPSVRELIGCQIMRMSRTAANPGTAQRLAASECGKWLSQAHTLAPVKPLKSFRPLRLEVSKVLAVYGVAILLGIALNATYVAYFRDDTPEWQMQEVAKGAKTRTSGRAVALVGDVFARLEALAKLGAARDVLGQIPEANTRAMAAQRLAYVLAYAGKFAEVEGVRTALEEAEKAEGIVDAEIGATAVRAHALAGAHAGSKTAPPLLIEQTVTGLQHVKDSGLLKPEEMGKLLAISYRPLQVFGKEDVTRAYDNDVVAFLIDLGQKGKCEQFDHWASFLMKEPQGGFCQGLFPKVPSRSPTVNLLDPLINDGHFSEAAKLVAEHLPTDTQPDRTDKLVDRPWRLLGYGQLLWENNQQDAAKLIASYFVNKKGDPSDWADTPLETVTAAQTLGQLCLRLGRKQDAELLANRAENTAKDASDKALRYAVASILYHEVHNTQAAKRNLQLAIDAVPAYADPDKRLATTLFLSRLKRQIDTFSIANNALKIAMGPDYSKLPENPSTEDLIRRAEASAADGNYRIARQTAELAGELGLNRPGEPLREGVLQGYALILDKFIPRHPTASAYGVGADALKRWPDLIEVHSTKTEPRAPRR